MSFNRDDYYTPQWYALQGRVLEAAHWVCADCGWPRARVAHHLNYDDGVLCPVRNLVALCDQCHRARHGLTNWVNEPYVDHMRRNGWVPASEEDRGCMSDFAGRWKRIA